MALSCAGKIREFDAVHASPPCQAYSITKHTHTREHPDLVGPTRELLQATGLPYVIENVPGAPLLNPITICGAAMGCTAIDDDGTLLTLRRHRMFESNILLHAPPCACGVQQRRGYGGYTPSKRVQADLIGCNHMTLHGLAQAIPPAYTEWIGRQLIDAIERAA